MFPQAKPYKMLKTKRCTTQKLKLTKTGYSEFDAE